MSATIPTNVIRFADAGEPSTKQKAVRKPKAPAPASPVPDASPNTVPDAGNGASPTLAEMVKDARRHLSEAHGAGSNSLDAYREIGRIMSRAKGMLRDREFGAWCKTNFKWSGTWGSTLALIHEHWSAIKQEHARMLNERIEVEYSVSATKRLMKRLGLIGAQPGQGATRMSKRAQALKQVEDRHTAVLAMLKTALDRVGRLKDALFEAKVPEPELGAEDAARIAEARDAVRLNAPLFSDPEPARA